MTKYEHEPRPEIESHYHIRHLIESQEKRSNDRHYHQQLEKDREEREDLIKDSKPICIADFYCLRCKEDFKAMSVRETYLDWTNTNQRISFYRTKCDKGHWCNRLITDRHKDSFFIKSKKMARDRGIHYADIVQPHEIGFNLLYGKK